MKIFNWVHRKFHPKDDKKTEPMNTYNEMEKQLLLKHVVLDDGLDSLGDGMILTIGTFGFDPLADFSMNNTEFQADGDQNYDIAEKEVEEGNRPSGLKDCGEEEEEEEEEEFIRPLVLAAFGCDVNEIVESNIEMGTLDFIKDDISSGSEGGGVILEDDKLKSKKKERVTLADLFSAEYEEDAKTEQDSAGNLKKKLKKKGNEYVGGKKKSVNSLAKKLSLGSGGDSDKHPIKKVQRLMRKMIKKKIHPSIEEKIPKTTIDESVCLLQNKVATV